MRSDTMKTSFAQYFAPKPNVGSLTPLTGLRLPGVWRRPVLDDATHGHLAAVVRAIFAATATRAGFGRGVHWTPKLLPDGDNGVGFDVGVDASGIKVGSALALVRSGPCARGHTTTGNAEGGIPYWPVMPNPSPWADVAPGSTLCYACYQRAGIHAKRKLWLKPPPTDAPT